MGVGLDKHIKEAYHWLGKHYNPGDEIYVFGFSRGAFTARSLVGMIHTTGLLKLNDLDDSRSRKLVGLTYNNYREGNSKPVDADLTFDAGNKLPIHFLGVWDTVGALGVPDHMHGLSIFDDPWNYRFLDVELTSCIKHARHALALDEKRASFMPTLWNENSLAEHPDAKQIWFTGVHCDVGGGYQERGLSDGPLRWMIEQAQDVGLVFRDGIIKEKDWHKEVKPDPWGVRHDSTTGVFAHLPTQPRNVPNFQSQKQNEVLHQSALDRHGRPTIDERDYWRTHNLDIDDCADMEIDAKQPWNATGIYLEANGQYTFTATGKWANGKDETSPAGVGFKPDFSASPSVQFRHITEIIFGKIGWCYRRLTRDKHAELFGIRREGGSPWGALIGAISNGDNPERNGTPAPHSVFEIGNAVTFPNGVRQPSKSGYLYCFMNDAWMLYDNNQGVVHLRIERIALPPNS